MTIDPTRSALHHLRGRAIREAVLEGRGDRQQITPRKENSSPEEWGDQIKQRKKKTNKNPHVPSASPLWSSHGTVGHKTGDERKRYFCICSPPSSAMYIGSVHPVFLTQGTDGVIFEYKMSFHLLCHKKKKNNTNKQEKKELTQKWCYRFFLQTCGLSYKLSLFQFPDLICGLLWSFYACRCTKWKKVPSTNGNTFLLRQCSCFGEKWKTV